MSLPKSIEFWERYQNASENWDNCIQISSYQGGPLRDGDEVVIPGGVDYIDIFFEYPLSAPVVFTISVPKEGLTRQQVCFEVCERYRAIYFLEENFGKGKDPGLIEGMLNRKQSSGLFGIWGHCLEDLVIHSLSWNETQGYYMIDTSS